MWSFNCDIIFCETNDCDPVYVFWSYISTFNVVLLVSTRIAVGNKG